MGVLTIIGIIILVIAGFFIPRFIGCLVIGSLLGGGWWWVFLPLMIVGIIIDAMVSEVLD